MAGNGFPTGNFRYDHPSDRSLGTQVSKALSGLIDSELIVFDDPEATIGGTFKRGLNLTTIIAHSQVKTQRKIGCVATQSDSAPTKGKAAVLIVILMVLFYQRALYKEVVRATWNGSRKIGRIKNPLTGPSQ